MTFPNIFENITRDNVANVNNHNILNTEQTVIIWDSLLRETMHFWHEPAFDRLPHKLCGKTIFAGKNYFCHHSFSVEKKRFSTNWQKPANRGNDFWKYQHFCCKVQVTHKMQLCFIRKLLLTEWDVYAVLY